MVGRRSYLSTTTNARSSPLPPVAFVGLGQMGLPMATCLLQGQVDVVAYDTNPAACKAAAMAGARIASSLDDCVDCSVLFTMLPNDHAVHAVMEQLSCEKFDLMVDCSTVSPATCLQWQAPHRLEAPVSGGVAGATAGTLTFMVGGSAETLERARPYLERMGSRILHAGSNAGSGAVAKLCNNVALAAQMMGICEALNLGEAAGVDPVVLADIFQTSTAACWSVSVNPPHPTVAAVYAAREEGRLPSAAARHYQGGFATKLMGKDLRLALQVAQEAKVAVPMTAMAESLYRLAELSDLGEKDFGVMLPFLQGKRPPSSS